MIQVGDVVVRKPWAHTLCKGVTIGNTSAMFDHFALLVFFSSAADTPPSSCWAMG